MNLIPIPWICMKKEIINKWERNNILSNSGKLLYMNYCIHLEPVLKDLTTYSYE